ncbi:MAG: hypothetical protein MUQ26_08495, partial [Armatimonadetes bacterium]|nr:hypothetical protein [Armatimonadota bacterium]
MHHAWSLLMLCVVMVLTGPFSCAASGSGSASGPKPGGQTPGGDVVIISFEEGEDVSGWRGGSVATKNASAGSRSYHLPAGATADVTLSGDWSGYRHLKFDVHNPGEVITINARFHDSSGRNIMAFEYNVYAGNTTQHFRIDGLRNNFTLGEGIETSQVARVEIILSERQRHDRCSEGIYIDNVRLSRGATEPYRIFAGGAPLADTEMAKPAGFYLPEFPGFDAGYHTWAIDPGAYQLLSLPGSGRDGVGRALEFKPLDVDSIRIWDSRRPFERAGTYTVTYWVKGPEGATFVDHAANRRTPLRAQWQKVQYDLVKQAGETQRFVLDAADLGGKSAWLDDFTVC